MSGKQLKRYAIALYGERGWQSKLAAALKVDVSSVRRWVSGVVPVPGPVAAAVECFMGDDFELPQSTDNQ